MKPRLLTDRDIDDLIVDIVARTREQFGIPEGTSGVRACEAIGLNLRWSSLNKQAGFWSEKDNAIFISRAITWQPRIDFTIYHEILHYILSVEESEIMEFYTNAVPNDPKAFARAIERCCNAGAAEFLLPRQRVREAIAKDGLSVDLIEQLTVDHRTSLLATAIQVALNAPVACYVVVCTHGPSPLLPGRICLHVEQAAMHPKIRYPWKRGSVIPDDHLFADVWRTRQPASGPSRVVFPTTGRILPCEHGEAEMIGGRVVGILYCEHPRRKGQLEMELLS